MSEVTKKNLKTCGIVWGGFYVLQIIIANIFYNIPSLAHNIGFSMGRFFGVIIIPLIVSILAKFISKKLFLETLWKMTLYIGAPITILSLIGIIRQLF